MEAFLFQEYGLGERVRPSLFTWKFPLTLCIPVYAPTTIRELLSVVESSDRLSNAYATYHERSPFCEKSRKSRASRSSCQPDQDRVSSWIVGRLDEPVVQLMGLSDGEVARVLFEGGCWLSRKILDQCSLTTVKFRLTAVSLSGFSEITTWLGTSEVIGTVDYTVAVTVSVTVSVSV